MKWGTFKQPEEVLAKIYSELPTVECKGLCHQACGLIVASPVEVESMETASGRPFTCSHDLTCDYLTRENRCSVYAVRPMICRLYGVAEGLLCEHGCVPSRLVSKAEGGSLINRASRAGGGAMAAEIRDQT